jgi:hypothetical protein
MEKKEENINKKAINLVFINLYNDNLTGLDLRFEQNRCQKRKNANNETTKLQFPP